jgi:hypothetical protein
MRGRHVRSSRRTGRRRERGLPPGQGAVSVPGNVDAAGVLRCSPGRGQPLGEPEESALAHRRGDVWVDSPNRPGELAGSNPPVRVGHDTGMSVFPSEGTKSPGISKYHESPFRADFEEGIVADALRPIVADSLHGETTTSNCTNVRARDVVGEKVESPRRSPLCCLRWGRRDVLQPRLEFVVLLAAFAHRLDVVVVVRQCGVNVHEREVELVGDPLGRPPVGEHLLGDLVDRDPSTLETRRVPRTSSLRTMPMPHDWSVPRINARPPRVTPPRSSTRRCASALCPSGTRAC